MEISPSVMKEIMVVVRNVCRRPNRIGVDHDDIAQDVAMRLWQAERVEHLSSWIYRTVTRRVIDASRKHRRFHDLCQAYAVENTRSYTVDMDARMAAREIVQAATKVLKDEASLYTFLACGTKTLTQEQVAKETHVTTQCVESRFRRAKDRVRTALAA